MSESGSPGSFHQLTTASGYNQPERTEEQVQAESDRELLALAHERFRKCCEAESDWRRRAQEELDFVDGLQHWDPSMTEKRRGLPCFTFDLIGPSVDQVVNDMRQNPPEAKVSPQGGGADKETAKVIQGLIRNIDQNSSAEIAYMTAYEHAVKIGRGWWHVSFDFEDDDSFEQRIVIKRVANPFSIYPDPAADEFDYSDMRFLFATETLDKDVFRQEYPDARSDAPADFSSTSDPIQMDWFPRGGVRIAGYWRVESSYETIGQLQDGSIRPIMDIPKGAMIVNRRKREKRTVKWAKITGHEILERGDCPAKWIPFVPVIGREAVVKGKRQLRGMIRAAMDANLAYDYARSKEAEAVSLAPISQWSASVESIEGFESDYADSNRRPFAVLRHRQYDDQNRELRPPQRISPQPASQALEIAIAHANEDRKATLSTYDPSLGVAGPEQSGKAILARQKEGDNAHFNYHDNLTRSMRHCARIEIGLIPHVYSEQRVIFINDPDGSEKEVQINQEVEENGVKRIFDLANPAYRYHVTVGTGPRPASRRAEAANAMYQLLQAVPGPMSRAIDLLIKFLDIPYGDEIADRVRPPDIQVQQDGQPPVPPQIAAKLEQASQMVQALSQQLHKALDIIQTKQMDLESRERIAALQGQVQLVAAAIKGHAADSQALLDAEMQSITQRLQLLHEAMPMVASDQQPQGQPSQPAAA